MQSMIDQAVQRILALKAEEAKADRTGTMHKAITSAFSKAGYKNIQLLDASKPLSAKENEGVTILTFQKWFELGRRVKEGEHALRIRGCHLRLYHRDQTRIASPQERKENFAKLQERAARREAKGQAAEAQA